MTNSSRRHRVRAICAAGVAFISLLAAACGSDADATSDSSSTTASATEDASVFGPENAATGTPVKIGLVTAEGGTAQNNPEAREAAEAAIEYANQYLGGLNGHEIELVTCADKSDGASATACANQFVQENVAALVVGALASSDAYFAALEPAGIPIISQSPAGSKAFASPLSFSITGGFPGGVGGLASHAVESGYEKLTFLAIDVPAFTAAFDALLVPAFEKAGVDAQAVLVAPGTPDVTSQVTAALGQDPDLVVVVGDATLCKAILPSLASLDTNDTPIAFTDACTDPSVLESVAPDALEGGLVYNVAVSFGDDSEAELYKAVMEQYAPDTGLGGKAGAGYVAALSLVRAYNQVKPAGEPGAATVADAMRTAKDVPSPGFPDDSAFTCDSTSYTKVPAACSPFVLLATMQDGELTDFRAVNAADYLN